MIQEGPTNQEATKFVYHSYWAHTLEFMSGNHWALESMLCTDEKPPQWEHLPQLEKACMYQWRPSAAKKISEICENSIETYTLPYVKIDSQWSLMYDAGNPKLVLCDNVGVEGGREGGSGGRWHVYAYGRFMLMCGKTHHNVMK